MLVVIAIELAVILVALSACLVAVIREGRSANRRNERLVALIVEEIGVEGEIAAHVRSTADFTGQIEVETRQTRKAVES